MLTRIGCVLATLLVFGCMSDAASPPVLASVLYDSVAGTYSFADGIVEGRVACANFTDQIDQNGWSFLHVITNESFPDDQQAYAAGLVEAYLTTEHMYNYWMNVIDGYCSDPLDATYCNKLWSFLNSNKLWAAQGASLEDTVPYWHQSILLWRQLAGIQDGYQRAFPINTTDHKVLQDFGFLFFNINGDLEDLEYALGKPGNMKRILGGGSCSALIKPLPGNTDIYFAHDTWNTYSSMNRIIKKYDLNFHETSTPGSPLVASPSITFSSYPGTLSSIDDYYLLSSKLAVMETTIGNNNATLWKYVLYSTNYEWVRVMIANRLAINGSNWVAYFSQHNSGTYNNEYMILDYNLFTPGTPTLPDNLLWVAEQLPGYIVGEDKTEVLRTQGYWASYNAPYFPLIYDYSGTDDLVNQYGDWYSYDKTPRALIFKRDQGTVVDMPSMIKLMRYNDFKNDPLSACNCTPPYSAENTIAARSDLNPATGTYDNPAEGHRSHGATDMKLTNYALFANLQFCAYGGPTHDQQPPFQWSTSDLLSYPHLGQPDLWLFTPLTVVWG